MPLKAGYSRATVDANIAQMIREKYPREQAIAAALDAARKSYWKRYPLGALPMWLAKDGRRMKNPVPMSMRVQVREASKLYENFSGHDAEEIGTIDKPDLPDVVLVVGTLDFVGYTATRDGVEEKYIHEFEENCRPLLCASPDGKQLVLLGGEYTFTERGIVDGR